MKAWSWGNFELDWSVAGPLTADYTQLQPDDRTGYPAIWPGDAPVGWSGGYPCSSYPCSCNEAFGHLDVLGAHAAAAQGVDIGSYDYVAYWLPGCPRYVNEGGESVQKGKHANQASVGSGSLIMVACWKGAEQTLGHEFGHSCEQPHSIVSSDAPMPLCLCSTCFFAGTGVISAERVPAPRGSWGDARQLHRYGPPRRGCLVRPGRQTEELGL